MISIYKKWIKTLILFLLIIPILGKAQINELKFEQLNWIGLTSSTPNSTWGRVTINYTGFPSRQFFNLNVNGEWVVQNMAIDSIFGMNVNQTVATFFDLGIEDGTDVTELEFAYSVTPESLLSKPTGMLLFARVYELDFQIGGEESEEDEYSNLSNNSPSTCNRTQITKSATLPDINKFVNQEQSSNECAPAAISNSLKYLQSIGKLDPNLKVDIGDIKTIVKWRSTGSPKKWPSLKKKHFENQLETKFLRPNDIDGLAKAIRKGCDVELDLNGHVEVIVGVREYSNGSVELDLFDDNQRKKGADGMHTSCIVKNRVDGKSIDQFVIECPKKYHCHSHTRSNNTTFCDASLNSYPFEESKQSARNDGAKKFKWGRVSEITAEACWAGSGDCGDVQEYLEVTLDNLTTSISETQLVIQWDTASEENNLGMNLWCAQMQGNQFKEITKLNSELIPSKAILPNYGASYSSTDYPYVNTNLQPGVQHCTLEDIDASGQCTLHCDQIDTVVVGEGNELSDTELNELRAKAITLCNEHKPDGVCLDQLLAPHQ